MKLARRVERMEQETQARKRGLVIVRLYFDDWEPFSAEEADQAVIAARREAGPYGQIVMVELVEDWRSERR